MRFSLNTEGVDDAFDEIERLLSATARGLSIEVWNQVLKRTPQFMGRMAASWSYSLHLPVFEDRSGAVKEDPLISARDPFTGEDVFSGYRKGHPAAIAVANAASAHVPNAFSLGDTVWISNGVDHGEGSYAYLIESGQVPLRKVNRPGAPVKMTLDYVSVKYAEGIYFWDAYALSKLRIGDTDV